jgi:DNA-binding transcriptional ArsR family regulator
MAPPTPKAICGGSHNAFVGKLTTPEAAAPLPLKGAALAGRRSRSRGARLERGGADAALDVAMAALSDPTRRAVVQLLARGPQRAGELAAALEMAPPSLSRHLRVLRKGGLITDDEPAHDARVRLYRLQPQALAPLQDWLAELEAFWGDQLQAFKAHAEKSAPARRKR